MPKKIIIENTVNHSKEYLIAVVCISKVRGNPDSDCYRMLDSLIKTELNKHALVVFRVDQDDDLAHYQKLVKKYQNIIDISVVVRPPFKSRREFNQGYADIYEEIKRVNYSWLQIMSDDAVFFRPSVVSDLNDINNLKNKFFIADKAIDGSYDGWFIDADGKEMTIKHPPTIDYPCIKKSFLTFVEHNFGVLGLFGPNSCLDNYWASIFASSEFYIVVPSYTRRSPQLQRFVDDKKNDSRRTLELIENSSDVYSTQCLTILKKFKTSFRNSGLDS